jgi:hypothetical protein
MNKPVAHYGGCLRLQSDSARMCGGVQTRPALPSGAALLVCSALLIITSDCNRSLTIGVNSSEVTP